MIGRIYNLEKEFITNDAMFSSFLDMIKLIFAYHIYLFEFTHIRCLLTNLNPTDVR